jgi:hypothetical protein
LPVANQLNLTEILLSALTASLVTVFFLLLLFFIKIVDFEIILEIAWLAVSKFSTAYYFLLAGHLLDHFRFGFLFSFKHTATATSNVTNTDSDNVGAIIPHMLE